MSDTILHSLAFYRYLEHIIIFIFPYFLDKTKTIALIYDKIVSLNICGIQPLKFYILKSVSYKTTIITLIQAV